jgi:FMN phosphatase YigB (HAD superfamily)
VNETPEKICYVGDSVKKDMEPAIKVGMKTILVDYKNQYENEPESSFGARLNNINELTNLL